MTAQIDPSASNVKYYPEILPEAMAVTASPSGTPIANYGLYSPNILILNSMFTDPSQDVKIRVDRDSSYATLLSECMGRSNREKVNLELPCANSLGLWAVGETTEVAYIAYTMKITIPTILEKIKYGYPLSTEETAIAEQFSVNKLFKTGQLKQIDTPMFQEILEVVKKVTVATGGHSQVGHLINIKGGQKAVILSIGTDSEFAGLSANDTFISINRSISEKPYVKLDTFAMPKLNHDIDCYIPGIDRLEINLESVSGVIDMPVRYRYAVSDITILEKIKWGIGMTQEEIAIANELDLYNAVVAGVM